MTYYDHNKFIRIRPSQVSDLTDYSNLLDLSNPIGPDETVTFDEEANACQKISDTASLAGYATALSESQLEVLVEYFIWEDLSQSDICMELIPTNVALVIFSLLSGEDSVSITLQPECALWTSNCFIVYRGSYLPPAPHLCFPGNLGESVHDDVISACKKRSTSNKFQICRLPISRFTNTILIFL